MSVAKPTICLIALIFAVFAINPSNVLGADSMPVTAPSVTAISGHLIESNSEGGETSINKLLWMVLGVAMFELGHGLVGFISNRRNRKRQLRGWDGTWYKRAANAPICVKMEVDREPFSTIALTLGEQAYKLHPTDEDGGWIYCKLTCSEHTKVIGRAAIHATDNNTMRLTLMFDSRTQQSIELSR